MDTGINSNVPITSGKMGDIAILAPTGSVTILGNSLYTRNECLSGATCGVGQGGDIFISASTGINFPANIIIASTSNSVGRVHGRSGDITFLTEQGNIALQVGTIWVRNEATLGSVFRAGHVTLSTGQGAVRINNLEGYARTPDGDVLEDNGNLIITATTGITVTGSIQTYVQNEASNTPFTTQKAGDVSFYTSNGPILVTGSINASADADASGVTGGNVTLTAPNGALTVSGTTLTNVNAPTAAGQAGLGGHVTFAAGGNIQAGTIDTAGTVGDGGTIGRTGHITLTSANGNIILSNGDTLPNVSSGGATFNGSGDILLHAPNGSVTVTSTTLRTAIFTTNAASHATADAGNLTILASTGVSLPPNLNLETMINVGGTSTGRGGDVTIITGQGNILFNHIWANTTTGQGGNIPGSGSVHLETGNGSVQLTDGPWGVTNYAITTNNGQTTAATGSVHITATTGITLAGPIQNFAQLGGGGTGTVGTGDISLYTSNGPIQVNGNVRTDANGRTTTGPTGDITLQAPNGAITIGGTTAPDANASDVGGQAAESGHITLLARDNIQTGNLDTGGNGIGAGGSVGRTGSIFAESELGNITVNLLSTDIGAIATHAGTGDIHLRALNGQININNSTIASRVFNTNALASNTADAGDVILEAGTGINFPPNTTIITMVNVGGTSTGRGGDVRLTTGQGNISFAFIWANTTSTQGGTIPGSGSVHLETGNGSVQLTDGLWGVTNYAITTNNGQTTAATGSVHITATTGITLAGPIQNFAQLGGGGTGTVGTGDVSLYTSNGPIQVNGNVRTDSNGRTTTGPTGDITLQAPNGAITIGGTTALDASASEVGGQAAESGHITLLARDNIQTGNLDTGGNSIGVGGSVGRTGSIFAESQLGNITVTNIWTDLGSIATHAGTGDIHLRAPNGQVTFLAFDLRTIVANGNPAASNTADAGDVIIEAGTGIIFPPGLTIQTMVNVGGTSTGRGGDVRLTTAQGDINFGFLWANTTTGQGGNIPGSGSVHLETGNGSVQLTDGTWGVTNYAFTTNNGQTTAATGSVHITATTGITIGGNVQNYVILGGGGTNSASTGDVSLYTSNGPIHVNASINNQVLGRTTSAPSGGITLTAPNGSITVNGSANTSTHAGDANGQAGTAGPITLTANSHISTGGLNSSGSAGANGTHAGGGHISLASNNGNITFNNFPEHRV
ncbi:MAG: hypothetical protein IPL28_24215 [Chloroflexi bacterium]|nr:hypothetical protein [Chloroflexota bacterium]